MNFHDLLNHEFEIRRLRNARFSLRSFARLLEIDPTTLGKILKAQGIPSLKSAERFSKKLNLQTSEHEAFLVAFHAAKERKKRQRQDSQFIPLDDGTFEGFYEWYYPIILESLRHSKIRQALHASLAKEKVSKHDLDGAFKHLADLHLVKKAHDGTYSKVNYGSTTLHIPTTSKKRREIQKKYLELAIKALNDVPFEQRENTTLTVALNSADLRQISKILQTARNRISRLSERSRKKSNTVYNISLAVYPVVETRGDNS